MWGDVRVAVPSNYTENPCSERGLQAERSKCNSPISFAAQGKTCRYVWTRLCKARITARFGSLLVAFAFGDKTKAGVLQFPEFLKVLLEAGLYLDHKVGRTTVG